LEVNLPVNFNTTPCTSILPVNLWPSNLASANSISPALELKFTLTFPSTLLTTIVPFTSAWSGISVTSKELLDYLGLSERLGHKPNQLSGGEQQRVAVARSLINNPGIIFADEPSGNLDSASSKELHQLLFKLRADFQQTFVIVTHNEELAEMSDRQVEMQDGRLAFGVEKLPFTKKKT